MVDGTTQLASPAVAPATTSEEDEVLKRNTDCVYFLASPLTCKKGSECEYRHSDVARVNPRDCYYWLNGNCLNPKCAFRHPPLDGLLGSDVSTPVGPTAPAHHATSYAMPKQGVACIFFQKGFCLKGHLCPFLHGPPISVTNKLVQNGPANSVSEPPKMANSGPVKPIYEPKFTQPTTQKPTPIVNGGNGQKIAPPSSIEESSRNKVTRVVPPAVVNEFKPNRNVNHGYDVSENDRLLNVKDADEYSREPSPGFDVLVENEAEDGEYFREKDEFGRLKGPDVDRGTYSQHRDYDRYDERDGQYVFGEDDQDRRPYSRRDGSDRFNGSDLRNRLSKQQRGVVDHGLRSVVSRENGIDRAHHRYDHHQNQGTISSRLKGRIKMPGRSTSPTNGKTPGAEMEFDIDRKVRYRYSPGRPMSLNQSRIGDRVKNDTNFTGPKRLSELKSVRPDDEQFSGKRKYSKMEEDLSFEGPKPLSEILKRKRGVNDNNDNNNNNNHISSVDSKDNNQKEKEEHKFVKADCEAENEKDNNNNNDSAVNYCATEVENEGGLNDEDALVGEELEGEYEYEQMDGEEGYELDEGEYVDEEEDGTNENVVYA
ncbi:zinc finger CCCH domain-containing protein 19-like [Rutidosis leptorrhynchoides]|uniref:zinc finger CCCH domain-containing protein 19-like n=1 Tax=Rutidosis leptorrhynchoides TaxID=125765 RepID=UPI003A998419